jgi:hypothetical protein
MAAAASATTLTPPRPPDTRYVLPGAADGYNADHFWEGRSIYRMEAPGIFYSGTDERGYPTGEPQNPRTGGWTCCPLIRDARSGVRGSRTPGRIEPDVEHRRRAGSAIRARSQMLRSSGTPQTSADPNTSPNLAHAK